MVIFLIRIENLASEILINDSKLNFERKDNMGAHKKVSRPKSPVTVRDPHYQEFDTQKERNIQKTLPRV